MNWWTSWLPNAPPPKNLIPIPLESCFILRSLERLFWNQTWARVINFHHNTWANSWVISGTLIFQLALIPLLEYFHLQFEYNRYPSEKNCHNMDTMSWHIDTLDNVDNVVKIDKVEMWPQYFVILVRQSDTIRHPLCGSRKVDRQTKTLTKSKNGKKRPKSMRGR